MSDPETLALLKSIDASLKALVGRQAPSAPIPSVASDRDLDGPYGDPVVKAKDPRDWTGPTQLGKKFSECPAEYLLLLADRYDYFAAQADEKGETANNGKPASQYKRLDAARARGWAARMRAGGVKPPAPATPGWADPNDDPESVPF